MTTDELLWNAKFEKKEDKKSNTYNYSEEWYIKKYYKDKELLKRKSTLIKPAI